MIYTTRYCFTCLINHWSIYTIYLTTIILFFFSDQCLTYITCQTTTALFFYTLFPFFLWSIFDLHHLLNHNCTVLLVLSILSIIYIILYDNDDLIISIIDLYYLLNNNYPSLFLRPMFDLHYSSNHSIEPFHLSCLNHSPVYYLLDHNSYLLPFAWLMIDLYYLRLSYRIFLKQ